MDAEETESVETEVSQADAPAAEAQQQESQVDSAQHRKRNDLEYNWAETRRGIAERDKKIQELESKLSQFSQEKENPIGEDDLLTAKDGRKVFRKEAEAVVKEALRQYEASTIEDRLVAKYPDFNEVVSVKNIEFLKETEPELAMSIANMASDPKAQSVAAYKLLKKLGIGTNNSSPEKDKAIRNSQKPLSVNAVTKQSAIGNAHLFENGLTPELKSQLWKEMQDCMKHA